MNNNIKATNIELTDAIRDYLTEKLQALDKYIDLKGTQVFIYTELEKTRPDQHNGDDLYRAEITVDNAGDIHYADTATHDFYAAIDLLQDEITRKIRRSQNKKRDLFRRGMGKIKKLMRFGK